MYRVTKMSKKRPPKRYTPEEMEALRKNPNVGEVKENRLLLTLEFRQQIYEEWVRAPIYSTVRKMLEANGFDTQRIGESFTRAIASVFQRGGRPRYSKASPETQAAWDKTAYMPTMSAEELVASGKFMWDGNRLIVEPDFEAELYRKYPQQSIEDGFLSVGITPADVGYHKIYWLKEKFESWMGRDTLRSKTRGRGPHYDSITVRRYAKHPYVQTATREKIELKTAFFKDAAPMSVLPIEEILKIFEIEPEIFSETERWRMSRVLREWKETDNICEAEASPTREMLRERMKALDRIAEKGFLRVGSIVPDMDVLQRKAVCLWVQRLPSDPGRKYSVKYVLSLLGISRASYYSAVKESYGRRRMERSAQDRQDAELIRQVMEYKGFAKGSRQIYMLLPSLTGKHLGLKKIRRLMKAYGIESTIRKSTPGKRMGGAALRKNVKPNLLRRRFRLYRPNEVRLTDVTYLEYGNGRKAYGSALLDPVTGRLIAFLVSEHNDLELALETLRQTDSHPCSEGGIYHSDQGVVYLSGTFQQEVSSCGFTQSMSKRGNCQDNAPQESFFGHFKDECSYAECRDICELRALVAKYADYYNHERRMWERLRMTPVEYEEYLLKMTEEAFSAYLAQEEEKYQRMKEQAAKRAIERAKNLGV